LFVVEIIIGLLILNTAGHLAAVIFPPLLSLTVYFMVVFGFEIQKYELRRILFTLAALIAFVSLFSTAVGVHYIANELNNLFSGGDIDQELLRNRLYYLDELFPHWLMAGSVIISLLFITLWSLLYYRKGAKVHFRRRPFFLPMFFGSLTGSLLALVSLEANVFGYGGTIIFLLLPAFLYLFRNKVIFPEDQPKLYFIATGLGSYLAMFIAVYIIRFATYQ
jgi:hypothetical protein